MSAESTSRDGATHNSPHPLEAGPNLTAEQALEILVVTYAMEDAQGAYNLEAPIKAALNAHPDTSRGSSSEGVAWRPEVRAFADLMEAQLRANDHKPGWKRDHPNYDLMPRLREEADELAGAIFAWVRARRGGGSLADAIGREAADVANFAMMIADVCGALASPAIDRGSSGGVEK